MKINLHYLPEKPYEDCYVLAFHVHDDGTLIYASSNHYCAKYGMFNCYEWTVVDDDDYEYQKGILAWAYMKDIEEELNNEIQR